MRRLGLLGLAAAAYVLAAWAVTPGFFDGIAPPEPYRWVNPPAQFKAANQPPLSGHMSVRTGSNGIVDPGSAFTQDGQASLSFLPGAFAPPSPGAGSVTVDLKPVATYPALDNLTLATNVYCITSSTPMVKQSLVTLRYSDLVPAPSDIYLAPPSGGTWTKIGSTGNSAPYTISAETRQLGCFGAGYPADAVRTASGLRIGGGQTVPVIAAAAILLVVLAGIPVALLRRRSVHEEEPEPR